MKEPAQPDRRAILIVDHGSRIAEANDSLAEVAALVARRSPEYIVKHAHMELAEPTIEQGFDACVEAGAVDVTVHPYLLAPGRHATLDIPRLVREAARKHPGVTHRVTEPLGVHELIAEVILARVREAAQKP
jgi:sirohydrochlorin ferrochelatase